MINIKEHLGKILIDILKEAGYEADDALVSQSNRPDLSDYQSNVAMPLAKKYKKSPIEIAESIKADLENTQGIYSVSIDGPGFINISLENSFLEGIECSHSVNPARHTVIVDYGGPNIAKEMHVGHLRPAIIGESIKRIMRGRGDKVLGDVHFGDWGTPIGMLIAQLRTERPDLEFYQENFSKSDFDIDIMEISALYLRAAGNFKENEAFKEEARIATSELQSGNPGYRALWKIFKDKSVDAVKAIYDALGVDFDLWLGESDVNDLLPLVFEQLLEKGLAVQDSGAVIVPLPDKGKKERAPLILRKSDGAYTYAATDLATIIQRVNDYNPDVIIYVTDSRQKEHFEQVFEVARKAGFVADNVSLEHIYFGTINGPDGKPFKTRDGGAMNLQCLIDLAISKAQESLPAESSEFTREQLESQTRQIAIGALIFQDLKNNRLSDYIFDTDNFTKSEGKTGAYIQYAIARINSILGKSGEQADGRLVISHPLERELLLLLARYPEALEEAYKRREPSAISEYTYLVAQKFSSLYAELSINGEPDECLKKSRIRLAMLTKEALTDGLNLLNIEAPERMVKAK